MLCAARYHGEVPQSAYEHARSGVGALHRRVLVSFHRVESVDAAGPRPHAATVPAGGAIDAAARIDDDQFPRLALPAARPDRLDLVLDPLLRRRAVGTDPGRVGALAALDRDRGRLCRRAGGDAANARELPAGSLAFAGGRGLLRALCA